MADRGSGGAPKGNRNAIKHGATGHAGVSARLIASGKAGALEALPENAASDMIVDWSRTLAMSERAFSTRVWRLGLRLAKGEGLRYPGLDALDPLGRISLIALQGLIDSIEARQMYALNLRRQGEPGYFRQQYNVAIDISHARRLRVQVIKALHDAVPIGELSLDRLDSARRRA